MGYIANYGYKDGSGEYFIIVDSGKCNGCGMCVDACPEKVLEIIVDDYDDKVVTIKEEHRKKIKYSCAPCKPVSGRKELPCQTACKPNAITHSW